MVVQPPDIIYFAPVGWPGYRFSNARPEIALRQGLAASRWVSRGAPLSKTRRDPCSSCGDVPPQL
jgi:hypothetical protein